MDKAVLQALLADVAAVAPTPAPALGPDNTLVLWADAQLPRAVLARLAQHRLVRFLRFPFPAIRTLWHSMHSSVAGGGVHVAGLQQGAGFLQLGWLAVMKPHAHLCVCGTLLPPMRLCCCAALNT